MEKEIKTVEFEYYSVKNGEAIVIMKLQNKILLFEEFFMRIGVLKTNPHIKNFYEKLYELEKIVKSVSDILA